MKTHHGMECTDSRNLITNQLNIPQIAKLIFSHNMSAFRHVNTISTTTFNTDPLTN